MTVVLEVEVAVAHGLLVFALESLGLAGFCDLRRQDLQQVTGELRQLCRVELFGVRDHQFLCVAHHARRQVVGQVGQHSSDRPRLLREYHAIEGGPGHRGEPGKVASGVQQR